MSKSYFTTSRKKIVRVMKTALGELPADLAIINGDVVNVYTGEIMTRQTVLIKDDTIAFVGEKFPHTAIGTDTRVIEAAGKTLIPGFIDGHTHVEDQWTIEELAKYALKGGTTTIITEMDAVGSLFGYRGITGFIKSCREQPVRFFFTIPPIIHTTPANMKASILLPEEIKRLLRRPEVLGLGEIPWMQAKEKYPRLMEMIAVAVNAGKKVEGHSAGARGNKLQAYFSTGTSSCHEPITAGEVLERLRLGIFVLIREGAVRNELGEVAKIKDEQIDFSLLGVCSDGLDPRVLVKHGYMDFIVQKLINYGFNPVRAIQMATLNVARHFGLDYVGGIAPGKLADIVIIPDPHNIKPVDVVVNGKIALRNGELTSAVKKAALPRFFYDTIRLKQEFSPDDFSIRVDFSGRVKVRVISQVTGLLTRESVLEMAAVDGLLEADIARDILKVAVIDRYTEPGKNTLGFIHGFGLKRGAIASSALWDGGNIGVIGAGDADMALAVNRIKELQGGTVVCADGKILAELSLPVAGFCSDQPMEFIAGKYDEIQRAAESLGTALPAVHMTVQILSTPFIPFIRISEAGLFSLHKNEFVGLVVE